MLPSLHIVVSCADRKRHPPAVRLRDIEGDSAALRFAAWRDAVTKSDGPHARAEDLYQGGYWSVVRELPALAAHMGWEPRLWIASAGYGMVGSDKQLVSYSATFSSGHKDSVSSLGENDAAPKWWNCAIAARGGLGSSLATLVKKEPRATVLVVASPSYIDAMSDDLVAAVQHARSPGAMFVISSRLPMKAVGSANWIPSSSALQKSLGGALVSLHARVARYLIANIPPSDFRKENLSHMTKKLNEEVGPIAKRTAGIAMTDEDVIVFIRQRVAVDTKVSHTWLLRELRKSGQACEQGRFRRLFKQVKS